MAAPSHVPPGADTPSIYRSPPHRRGSWVADRPGELVGSRQPSGPALGNQGPDQGFALALAARFEPALVLGAGEHPADVLAGCAVVALRRASLYGRAPVVHDVRLALTLFGFLGEAPDDLVEWRRPLFDEVSNPHHHRAALRVAESVPEAALRTDADAVAVVAWRELLDVST
ncbi:MAG: hypothetical protein ACE5GB_11360 [Acidimicrobiales bacterium]